MIKSNSIQNVMDAMRVEEVLAEFIHLQKKGANYAALCPFHDEKTPSFSVSPAKGIYKCFGCSKAGNGITFLMEHENLSYIEAIKYLANKYNIELEETEQTQEDIDENLEKESLYIVNEYATQYFHNNLSHTEGKNIGLSYFKERGFTDTIIEQFQLGYAIDNAKDFSTDALKKGFNPEYLLTLGLTKKYDNGDLVDFFRGRVTFPIHNLTGKVVGFGARTLSNDKKTAKYLNSPESPIYHKSQVLYGMHLAKKSIPKENYCLLVEGYTDVISLHQGGITNVVASSGTALTLEQLKLIRRFTENLYLLYDGDQAGINAALRGTDLALEQGLNVKLILLPDSQDPDTYVKSHGGELFKKYIAENAQDIVTFKANLYKIDTQNDPIKKAESTRDIIQTISLISDNIKRSFYIKECALLMGIDEEILSREVQKTTVQKRLDAKKYPSTISQQQEEYTEYTETNELVDTLSSYQSNTIIVEIDLCRILIEYGDRLIGESMDSDNPLFDDTTVVNYVFTHCVESYEFESQLCLTIFNIVKEDFEKGVIHPFNYYVNHTNTDISKFAIKYCSQDKNELYDWAKKNKAIQVKEYGENYILEVNQVLTQVKISYYEKLSKQIMDIVKKEVANTNELNETTIMHMNIQQEFLNVFKELKKEINDVFRKRIS